MRLSKDSSKDINSKKELPTRVKEKSWVYGVILLVIVVWFLIKNSQGNNDLTNWIIALANVVMASAAIVGVIVAKGWRKEATTDKIIELGGAFFIEDLTNLQHKNASPFVLNRMKSVLTRVRVKGFLNRQNIVALYEHYRFFREDSESYFDVYKSASTRDQQIKNLGWVVDEKYNENHNEIIYNAFQIYDLSRLINYEVKEIFYQLGFNIDAEHNDFYGSDVRDEEIVELTKVNSVLEVIEEVLEKVEGLNNNLKLIRKNNPTLFDYFIIK